jgi:hypothetical protein
VIQYRTPPRVVAEARRYSANILYSPEYRKLCLDIPFKTVITKKMMVLSN